MKRGRISEPSTWGGLVAMCIGLMPMLPDQFQPALAVAGPSGLVSPHTRPSAGLLLRGDA